MPIFFLMFIVHVCIVLFTECIYWLSDRDHKIFLVISEFVNQDCTVCKFCNIEFSFDIETKGKSALVFGLDTLHYCICLLMTF